MRRGLTSNGALSRIAARSLPSLAFGAAALASAVLSSLALSGCNPNPYCLNCVGDGGVAVVDLVMISSTDWRDPSIDAFCPGDGPTPEICNGVDDDCDGIVDNVDPRRLAIDPNNCGACGKECKFAGAAGFCAAGVCSQGPCQPGFYDTNKMSSDGCEYACTPLAPSVCKIASDCSWGLPCTKGSCVKVCATDADCPASTICDPNTKLCEGELCDGVDNNCNGKIDEGFDLKGDVNNCGACHNVCTFPNAVGACAAGVCAVQKCSPAYYDVDKSGANGCEYFCHVDKPDGKGGTVQVPIDPPTPEVCNGIDDNCDGIIDNNPVDVGKPCDDFCPSLAACVGLKNCAFTPSLCAGKCCGVCTEGTTLCAGGQKVCQMGKGPMLEVCNGVDDNCDGQIDEGFNLNTDPVNCGKCGKSCVGMLPNAVAGCAGGQCTLVTCEPGFADVDKNIGNGCEYTCPVNPPTIETCNNKDDDCDGIVDDHLTPPANMCNQTAVCSGSRPVCCGATGWMCNYPSVSGKIEVSNVTMCQGGQSGATLSFVEKLCDGVDGNCNGQVDESFPSLGKACFVGVGICAGKAAFICDPKNAMQVSCPAVANPNLASDELCNGLDDDCDGTVDERTDGPNMCNGGGAHLCKGWRDPTVQVGAAYVYQYEASRVDASANLVGASASRACSQAGVLPWAPVTQTAATAACAAVLDSKGSPMRLCTAAEWQTACDIGVLPPTQVWSYAANPGTYAAATCNGADQGTLKAWATGAGVSCYAKNANGNIYDMSGNVAEWTSTPVVTNNITYYSVRGGAYNTASRGINCNFDFLIEQPSYQYSDIGFRCCADNPP